ncbi:DUF664 domain-containing protein [Cryptosporangium arvum]|uniref:mycothiol transferase n=1 Tax=Cryptosporangium arvum TaxID=80871 RepID=UPI0004B47F7D|nr:DUF664 domain-containing protein [Cryptosporangium arvum]
MTFFEATDPAADRREVFVRYLDYFRESALSKAGSLSEDALRSSPLPSGWTPIELLQHLRYVELRWIEWGFEGRAVPEPWGDRRDDRWYVAPDRSFDDVAAALRQQGAHTRAFVEAHDLDEIGAPGPRWDGAAPASLERVLFHLLQEYARHVGHLDVVVELSGGSIGE